MDNMGAYTGSNKQIVPTSNKQIVPEAMGMIPGAMWTMLGAIGIMYGKMPGEMQTMEGTALRALGTTQ